MNLEMPLLFYFVFSMELNVDYFITTKKLTAEHTYQNEPDTQKQKLKRVSQLYGKQKNINKG